MGIFHESPESVGSTHDAANTVKISYLEQGILGYTQLKTEKKIHLKHTFHTMQRWIGPIHQSKVQE